MCSHTAPSSSHLIAPLGCVQPNPLGQSGDSPRTAARWVVHIHEWPAPSPRQLFPQQPACGHRKQSLDQTILIPAPKMVWGCSWPSLSACGRTIPRIGLQWPLTLVAAGRPVCGAAWGWDVWAHAEWDMRAHVGWVSGRSEPAPV